MTTDIFTFLSDALRRDSGEDPLGYLTITMTSCVTAGESAPAFGDFGIDYAISSTGGMYLFGADCGAGEFSAEAASMLTDLLSGFDASTPCTPIKTATGVTAGFLFDISAKPIALELFGGDYGAGTEPAMVFEHDFNVMGADEAGDAFLFVAADAGTLTDMAVDVIAARAEEGDAAAARDAWDQFDDFAWFDAGQAQEALAELF